MGAYGFFFYLVTQTEGIIAGEFSSVGKVSSIDFIFAVTSFILTTVAYSQTFMYPSESNSRLVMQALALFSVIFALIGIWELLYGHSILTPMTLAALYKGGSSGSKYAFQMYLNYRCKSTVGLSSIAVGSDWVGAIFCLLQIQIDAMIDGYGNMLVWP